MIYSITSYTYRATKEANGIGIDSNDLLSEIKLPDLPPQRMAYNAQGQLIQQTNSDGSIHQYQYDAVGRQILDAVTKFATNVDPTVVALGTTYNTLGQVTLATSYNTDPRKDALGLPTLYLTAPAASEIVNQVKDAYDGLGNLIAQYQSVNGEVDIDTTPAVQYVYSTSYEGDSNYSRLTAVTYPTYSGVEGSYQIAYGYSGLDAAIGRITSVSEPGQTLETYNYLGLSTVVGATLPQPGITESVSFDNFDSIANITWTQSGSSTPLAGIGYTYDPDGDILSRNDLAAYAAGVTNLAQTYSYSALHELTGYNQGTLNTSSSPYTISGPPVESWSLDSQGNRYSGSGVFNTTYNPVDQTGTANLIVRMDVWERFYQVARTAASFIASGRLQNQRGVIHVLVSRLENLSDTLGKLRSRSRGFQ